MQQRKGMWIDYSGNPGTFYFDSNYMKMYDDLKKFNTGWSMCDSLDQCIKLLCDKKNDSEEIRTDTNIHIFFEEDLNEDFVPRMYIRIVRNNSGKIIDIDIVGALMKSESTEVDFKPNYSILPRLLNELINKLELIGADERIISYYKDKLSGFKNLCTSIREGFKTQKDMLLAYKMINRRDTPLARMLIMGRNIQEDYNSLNRENKIEDRNIILDTLLDTNFKSLKFASPKLFNSRSFQLSLLVHLFGNKPSNIELFKCREYCKIIQAIYTEMEKNYHEFSSQEYIFRLIDFYFRYLIKNNRLEEILDPTFLTGLSDHPNLLSHIEDRILYGPEPTEQQETIKSKIITTVVKYSDNK